MNDFVTKLFHGLKGEPTAEEARNAFLARKSELEAELAQADTHRDAEVTILQDQIEAFRAAHEEETRGKRNELTEIEEGLTQVEAPEVG